MENHLHLYVHLSHPDPSVFLSLEHRQLLSVLYQVDLWIKMSVPANEDAYIEPPQQPLDEVGTSMTVPT